jgi:hypothetical protein
MKRNEPGPGPAQRGQYPVPRYRSATETPGGGEAPHDGRSVGCAQLCRSGALRGGHLVTFGVPVRCAGVKARAADMRAPSVFFPCWYAPMPIPRAPGGQVNASTAGADSGHDDGLHDLGIVAHMSKRKEKREGAASSHRTRAPNARTEGHQMRVAGRAISAHLESRVLIERG